MKNSPLKRDVIKRETACSSSINNDWERDFVDCVTAPRGISPGTWKHFFFFWWELLVLLWNKTHLGLEVEVNMVWFHKVSLTFFVRRAAWGHLLMRLQISLYSGISNFGRRWLMIPNLNWNAQKHEDIVSRYITPLTAKFSTHFAFFLRDICSLLYLRCKIVHNHHLFN